MTAQEAGGGTQQTRRVLVLSHTTGYQLRAFNEVAEKLDLELVFATDRCHKLDDPWQDRAVAVRFHELEQSTKAIVERHRSHPIDGVVAVGDRPVVLAARAAEALGLPWHSVRGAQASSDKRRSRAALATSGLPSPHFFVLPVRPSTSDLRPPTSDVRFPCVLKPFGLSGSRGVIRVNDEREFEKAFRRIRALLNRPEVRSARTGVEDEILVEDFIDGREFAIEGVLTHGLLRVFAIFDKPDPLEGPFFEETIYVTPSSLDGDRQAGIIDHVARAADALGLSHGPIHAECRVSAEGRIYVLEMAGRPIGGLCSRVLTFRATRVTPGESGAASLEEVLLRHAIGEPVEEWMREASGAAVMMIPIPARGILRRVDGEVAARTVPGITDVRITAKVGQFLEPLPEAGSYLGFIFARGAAAVDAEQAVREAHGQLTFDIAREITVNREP